MRQVVAKALRQGAPTKKAYKLRKKRYKQAKREKSR